MQEQTPFNMDVAIDSAMSAYKPKTDTETAADEEQLKRQLEFSRLFEEAGGNSRKFKRLVEKKFKTQKWKIGSYKK